MRRHERGLLYTSTVILLTRLDESSFLPAEPLITAITLAELTVGPLVATSDEERAARQAHVQQAEADFEPLPFDAARRRGHSGGWRTPCAKLGGSPPLAPTTQ